MGSYGYRHRNDDLRRGRGSGGSGGGWGRPQMLIGIGKVTVVVDVNPNSIILRGIIGSDRKLHQSRLLCIDGERSIIRERTRRTTRRGLHNVVQRDIVQVVSKSAAASVESRSTIGLSRRLEGPRRDAQNGTC